jgi:hypothetical protein
MEKGKIEKERDLFLDNGSKCFCLYFEFKSFSLL